ncbi:MAG: hypothetical protein ABSE66_09905 [Thermoplasmata archaeon]|jgi:hypothetical protein
MKARESAKRYTSEHARRVIAEAKVKLAYTALVRETHAHPASEATGRPCSCFLCDARRKLEAEGVLGKEDGIALEAIKKIEERLSSYCHGEECAAMFDSDDFEKPAHPEKCDCGITANRDDLAAARRALEG